MDSEPRKGSSEEAEQRGPERRGSGRLRLVVLLAVLGALSVFAATMGGLEVLARHSQVEVSRGPMALKSGAGTPLRSANACVASSKWRLAVFPERLLGNVN